eukprot:SAG31_NODE_3310_length_4435_cov_3.950876_3_plen_108_part_00
MQCYDCWIGDLNDAVAARYLGQIDATIAAMTALKFAPSTAAVVAAAKAFARCVTYIFSAIYVRALVGRTQREFDGNTAQFAGAGSSGTHGIKWRCSKRLADQFPSLW